MNTLNNTICFIDTETTGLRAYKCMCLEASFGVLNQETMELGEIKTFYFDEVWNHYKPNPYGMRIDVNCANINGRTLSQMITQPIANMINHIIEIGKGKQVIFAGCNVEYDINSLITLTKSIWNIKGFKKNISHHSLDIYGIATALFHCGKLPGFKGGGLDSLIKYFNLPYRKEPHTSKDDVQITYDVYKKLLEKIKG